jgi:ABC-type sugar transport system permease subunit
MKITLFIFLFALSLISSGCFTYYPSSDSPDSFKVERNEYIKITVFQLNNGDFINVSDYDVKYYKKYKSYEKVFVCTEKDTYEKNQIFGNSSKIKKNEKIIPSEQVKTISVERRKTNVVKTVLYAVGITVITAAALILIFAALLHNSFHGYVTGG